MTVLRCCSPCAQRFRGRRHRGATARHHGCPSREGRQHSHACVRCCAAGCGGQAPRPPSPDTCSRRWRWASRSLLLVQPVLVSALLFALPLSARLAHRKVSRAEWVWALLLTGALTVFVALARASTGTYSVSVTTTITVAVVCAAAVTLCVLLAHRAATTGVERCCWRWRWA